MRAYLTLASLAAVATLVGCTDALPPGTTPAASPAAPGSGDALVNFVRPSSSCDTGEYAIVVDERGRFVANVPTNSQASVRVNPGPHLFFAWSNDDVQVEINRNVNPVAAVSVDAVAGQSHYVAVEVATPCSVRSTFELRAVAGTGGAWADLEGWLAKAQPMTTDRAAGQARLDEEPVHLRRHMELGREKLVRLERNHAAADEHLMLIQETANRTE